jgi:hypothetical protein
MWEEAKCMNFINDPGSDGFYTLAQYADPSFAAIRAGCSQNSDWEMKYLEATEESVTPWTEEPTVTFREDFDPAQCGAFPPVPTGITVTRDVQPTTYEEKVCLMPGCYYVPQNDTCAPELGGSGAANTTI